MLAPGQFQQWLHLQKGHSSARPWLVLVAQAVILRGWQVDAVTVQLRLKKQVLQTEHSYSFS